MRKKTRKDSKQLIYEIYNTVNKKSYLGVTSISQFYHTKSVRYAANRRFQKHYSKAKTGETKWKLHKDMRKYGGDVYNVWILDVVKGKALDEIITELMEAISIYGDMVQAAALTPGPTMSAMLGPANLFLKRGEYPRKVADVTIKSGAVLFPSSIVTAGVTIGENSIISVGSVVTQDIPDFCVVVGNPARVIKKIEH